jgi:hypothetical protein
MKVPAMPNPAPSARPDAATMLIGSLVGIIRALDHGGDTGGARVLQTQLLAWRCERKCKTCCLPARSVSAAELPASELLIRKRQFLPGTVAARPFPLALGCAGSGLSACRLGPQCKPLSHRVAAVQYAFTLLNMSCRPLLHLSDTLTWFSNNLAAKTCISSPGHLGSLVWTPTTRRRHSRDGLRPRGRSRAMAAAATLASCLRPPPGSCQAPSRMSWYVIAALIRWCNSASR